MSYHKGTQKALKLLRRLPRVTLTNVKENKKVVEDIPNPILRNKGFEARDRHVPVWFDKINSPFLLKFKIQKWAKERTETSYVPLTLKKLQLMVDLNRIDPSLPVDVTQLNLSGFMRIDSRLEHGGVILEDEGFECFCTPLNLEVQFASEAAIAAVEKAGGTVTTSYYDPHSLSAALRPTEFFRMGQVIPRRLPPPQRLMSYYTDPRNRGYLCDPDLIPEQRLILSQKYGYELPSLENSPLKDLLVQRKDPRQVFYGLQPGWFVNLADQVIMKPTDPELVKYYAS